MAPPPLTATELALVAVGVGAVVVAAAARALLHLRRDRRAGALVAVDEARSTELRSDRYRLIGRPDAIRRLADGSWVPVEVKSRPAPTGGPAYSHRVQVWAYCLLVEESTGRSPRFGLLRYRDADLRVPWGDAEREELLRLRQEVDRPYDGRARPSVARCSRCPWADVCDARAG